LLIGIELGNIDTLGSNCAKNADRRDLPGAD
jgi:hypothetical protein